MVFSSEVVSLFPYQRVAPEYKGLNLNNPHASIAQFFEVAPALFRNPFGPRTGGYGTLPSRDQSTLAAPIRFIAGIDALMRKPSDAIGTRTTTDAIPASA